MKNQRFETVLNNIGQLVKSLQAVKSQKMAQYGLKGTTCLCLCQIYRSENGLNAGELAVAGEIDKAQVSRCVSELAEKGFLYREDREGRRYKQKYRLTKKGMEVAADIVQTVDLLHNSLINGIAPEELAVFQRVLRCLCDNFRIALDKKEK